MDDDEDQDSGETAEAGANNVVLKSQWDPMTSSDWDKEKHTRESILRIKSDLDNIYKDPPEGICVMNDDDNITKVRIL